MSRRLLPLIFAIMLGFNLPAMAEEVDVREATTPSGLKFRYVKSDAQDIVAISFSFPGGVAHDLMKGPQVSFFGANTMFQSSDGIKLGALKEDMDDLQGGIVISPHLEYQVGLALAPSANIAEVVKLANRVLTKPDFPEKKIRQIREDLARQNEKLRKRHDIIATLAFIDTLGKPHPYGANYIGDPARIRAVTREDLIKWHRNRIVREGVLVTVVGNIYVAEMVKLVEALFDGLPQKGNVPKLPDVFSAPAPREPVRIAGTNAQAIIIAGGFTQNASDYDTWSASFFLNRMLAKGAKSRLFKTVREQTGKTYGFNSLLQPYSKIGTLAINGRVSKENLQETVKTIKQTIADFRNNGPTAEEIADLKAGYTNADAKTLKNNVKQAVRYNRWQRYGWSLETVRRYQEIDQTIDLTDRKYREALIPENPVIVIAE